MKAELQAAFRAVEKRNRTHRDMGTLQTELERAIERLLLEEQFTPEGVRVAQQVVDALRLEADPGSPYDRTAGWLRTCMTEKHHTHRFIEALENAVATLEGDMVEGRTYDPTDPYVLAIKAGREFLAQALSPIEK